jgi:hypothetical protein
MNRELIQRITNYLSGGGLFNPEMANHEAVRDLLIDCRDELAKPEQNHGFDRTGSHMAGEYVDTKQENLNVSEACTHKSDKNIHEPVCSKDPFYCWSVCCQLGKVCKNIAPPRKEWVGLTDEEIQRGHKESWVTQQAFESAVWWAEAKLKEKNHD